MHCHLCLNCSSSVVPAVTCTSKLVCKLDVQASCSTWSESELETVSHCPLIENAFCRWATKRDLPQDAVSKKGFFKYESKHKFYLANDKLDCMTVTL